MSGRGVSREAHLAGVVCGVLRQALRDAGARSFVLEPAESPEARLVRRWIEAELGAATLESEAAEGSLVADPSHKTALLLEPAPREAVVHPVGDVYASEVAVLAGGWTPGPVVGQLAALCGGIDVLDDALRLFVDARRDWAESTAGLPPAAAEELEAAWHAARFARRRVGLVPKLSWRTLGIDLFA